MNIDPRSVHTLVIGEHGDSEMIPWSTVRIGENPYDEMKKVEVFQKKHILNTFDLRQ